MRTVFIYALCEPASSVIRYIGKTVDLKRRMREHRKPSRIAYRTHLYCWLRSLGEVPPRVVVLQEVPESESCAAEKLDIRVARNFLQCDLVNSTDGGDGVTMTPETCKKIGDRRRGRPWPAESLAKVLGPNNHQFGKRGPGTSHYGHRHSSESRKSMGRPGRPWTAARRDAQNKRSLSA
jgi:hypothetical protein